MFDTKTRSPHRTGLCGLRHRWTTARREWPVYSWWSLVPVCACTAHAPQCWQQSCPLSFPIGSARAEPSLLADGVDGAVKSPMVAAANLVEVAALVGDTARATILAALMGGPALT